MTAVFPDPFEVPVAPAGRRRRVMVAVALILLVTVVLAVVLARAASSTTGPYRTVVVADHDVESVITGVGSIEPVSQATVAFPISGTVATVDVAVGDTVATGQTLATIDTADLTVALHEQQAALASAQLALADALAGPSSGDAASGSSGAATTTTSSSPVAGGSASPIAAAQQAVVSGQKAVDAVLAVADRSLASAAQVCAALTTTSPDSTTTATSTSDAVSACQTALQQVSAAQADVTSAQKALASASSALDALLAQQAAAASSSSASTPNGSSSSAAPSGSSPSGSTTSSSDLIALQKAVDALEADVAVAEQALAQATIVTPISGTVAAVDLTAGDSVSAASSTAHIVVVGAGGVEVTTMVSVDDIPDVEVGQPATVLADGSSDAVSGQVVAIVLTPATGTTGATYRVTIGLEGGGSGLGNGATGSVSIVTAGVTSALSVPTSAVHADGETYSVTVVDGSSTSTVEVQVGVVGSTYTQITGGLAAGQVVSLADLDQPLPGSATSSSNGSTTDERMPFTFDGSGPPGFNGGGG